MARPPGVQKIADLERFKRWIALPGDVREPKTQAEFAKQYNVSEDTLSDWKQIPGFWDDVNKHIEAWARAAKSGVVKALIASAEGNGKNAAQDRKLFAQWVDKWKEEGKLEVPGLGKMTEMIAGIIARGKGK